MSDDLLAGLQVVELGDGIAGSVAATTLRLLGAEVTKLVPRDRRLDRYEPTVPVGDGGSEPAIIPVLDVGKEQVVDDGHAAAGLLGVADIVIEDVVEHGPALTQPMGRGAWVTVSPFGLSGPRRGAAGGELVAQAAGGLMATIAPSTGDRPVSPPGFVALRAVGQVAALAALHGLDLARRRGSAVRVDVSAQEAVVFTAALPECAHVLYRCPGRAGSGRYLAPSGLFGCSDGQVRIAAIEDHQWRGMVLAMGSPSWTDGLDERPARIEHSETITAEVEAWTAMQDKDDCAELLQKHRVPATPVNGPDELLASSQLDHRGSLRAQRIGDRDAIVLGPPWRLVPEADRAMTDRQPRSGRLDDLRVLELTHVLAGPIVGSLLGAMGAQVVRFEELARLDIYRRTGPFADGVAGTERGAYFSVANHSKASIAVDPDETASALQALLARSDVVIENVGRARLDRAGVDLDAVAGMGVLGASVSGFGRDGPMADYRVYANNVQAYGGLAGLTVDHEGHIAKLGTVLADPLSSVVAATVVAAWALGSHRDRGGVLDVAMAEVVASTIAEYVTAASMGRSASAPLGNDLAPFAPHGVYRAKDDRWVAIAVQDDDEWHALKRALGQPGDLERPEWNDAVTRWNDRRTIDAILDAAAATTDAASLAGRLRGFGVRSSIVLGGADLIEDEHLAARGFFPEIEHPDPDLGRARLVGLPWRFVDDGSVDLGPPPALGSTTVDDWLGADGR